MGESVTNEGETSQNEKDAQDRAEHGNQRPGDDCPLQKGVLENIGELHGRFSLSVPAADEVLSMAAEDFRHFERGAEIFEAAVINNSLVQIEKP
jgi:hypothetical protein